MIPGSDEDRGPFENSEPADSSRPRPEPNDGPDPKDTFAVKLRTLRASPLSPPPPPPPSSLAAWLNLLNARRTLPLTFARGWWWWWWLLLLLLSRTGQFLWRPRSENAPSSDGRRSGAILLANAASSSFSALDAMPAAAVDDRLELTASTECLRELSTSSIVARRLLGLLAWFTVFLPILAPPLPLPLPSSL